MRQIKIKRVLCPIKGSTTDDVCAALNKVVPELERTHGTIDPESITINPDGDALVLTVCVPVGGSHADPTDPDRHVGGNTAF